MRKFLLWDNDGVLVDTERWHYVATRDALAGCGVTLDEDTYLDYRQRGQTSWSLAETKGVSAPMIARQRAERNRRYRGYLRSSDLEIPGVAETLPQLARRFRMAIVTTSSRTDFDLIHDNLPHARHFEFVLTAEDYEKTKPAPDGYLAALERFGASPSDAVAIEDSVWGLRAAQGAGIDCIIVRNSFTTHDDLDGAWHVAESVRDLPNLLVC